MRYQIKNNFVFQAYRMLLNVKMRGWLSYMISKAWETRKWSANFENRIQEVEKKVLD